MQREEGSRSFPVNTLLTFLMAWQYFYKVSNTGIGVLLLFIKSIIMALGEIYQSPGVIKVANALPQSYRQAHMMHLESALCYEVYTVCGTCHSIFPKKFCQLISEDGSVSTNVCPFIPLPKRTGSQQMPCGTPLLLARGAKAKLSAAKVYCYQSLRDGLQGLASRGLLDDCEHWRTRTAPANLMADVYDGHIWRDFSDFLDAPNSLLFCLNVDWFQPFQHVTYSVGAIYLSILNLPRSKRHLLENIILVGIIPGPKEPNFTINSYLTPLVKELKLGWISGPGFQLMDQNGLSVTVRVALGCVNCDIPASRKVCGFLGHRATLGCNKCLKHFSFDCTRANYSGFDRETWDMRSYDQHRRDCKKLENEKSVNSLKKAESELGVRNSVLLSLPYFDPIRQYAIDPMHNLFMGTAKHVLNIWMDKGQLPHKAIGTLQKKIKKFSIPSDMGRLPCNLSTFSGFTANQWKNWILVYSSVVLKDIIPVADYNCWLLFVRACSLLVSGAITTDDIEMADEFLFLFCTQFQELYGEQSCTFNMHLHLHLRDSLRDYGPLHSFWCFSFERYNGILSGYHTNKRGIEEQLMKKFLFDQRVHALAHSKGSVGNDGFLHLLPSLHSEMQSKSLFTWNAFHSFRKWQTQGVLKVTTLDKNEHEYIDYSLRSISMFVSMPPNPQSSGVLNKLQSDSLLTVYQLLYPNSVINFLPYAYQSYKWIMYAGDRIGNQSTSTSSSVITAYWPGYANTTDEFIGNCDSSRVGVVQKFLLHTVHITHPKAYPQMEKVDHLWANISWKKCHRYPVWFGLDSLVNSCEDEIPSAASFMPVAFIRSRCAHVCLDIDFGDAEHDSVQEKVFIAVPLKFQISA